MISYTHPADFRLYHSRFIIKSTNDQPVIAVTVKIINHPVDKNNALIGKTRNWHNINQSSQQLCNKAC